MSISPSSARSSPASTRNRVVLPEPLSPWTSNASPASTENSSGPNTGSSLRAKRRPRAAISGGAGRSIGVIGRRAAAQSAVGRTFYASRRSSPMQWRRGLLLSDPVGVLGGACPWWAGHHHLQADGLPGAPGQNAGLAEFHRQPVKVRLLDAGQQPPRFAPVALRVLRPGRMAHGAGRVELGDEQGVG